MTISLGKHYLVEYSGLNVAVLSRIDAIEPALLNAVEACGGTYVAHKVHPFSPHGLSAIVLIAESHISLHTWPEKAYAGLDLFTCSDQLDAMRAIEMVGRVLEADTTHIRVVERGPGVVADSPSSLEIVRIESPCQTIELIEDAKPEVEDELARVFSTKFAADPGFPWNVQLLLDGQLQVHSSFEEIYHEYLAHVPIALHGSAPRNVLVLGGGDGLLARELLKYPALHIELVELDERVVTLFQTHPTLRRMNGDSLSDPRVQVVIADAYEFVRDDTRRWDAIWLDPPLPDEGQLSRLSSREMYGRVRERLAPNGFAVWNANNIGMLSPPDESGVQHLEPENTWPQYYHTLRAAGFQTIQPYLSTLEFDSPEAVEALLQADTEISVAPEVYEELASRAAREGKEGIEEYIARTIFAEMANDHVAALQEGFVAVANSASALGAACRMPAVELHVLNEERLRRAFAVEFPMPGDVDPELVSTVERSTFPNRSAVTSSP